MVTRFQDLETFKVSRKFAKDIYQLSNSGQLSKDFSLKDQLRRAAVSIMLNIAEGFDSGSSKSFIQFLRYAYRSSSEVRATMFLVLDLEYITPQEFTTFNNK